MTKLEAVYVRLDPGVKAILQKEADAQHRALSNLVAKILIDHCDSKKAQRVKSIAANGHMASMRA